MSTLLLCFFVFLLTTAKVDQNKLSAASGYMAARMGLLPDNSTINPNASQQDAKNGAQGDADQTLSIDDGMKLLLGGKDMFKKGEATPVYSTKSIEDLNTFMNQIRGLRNIIEVRGHTSTDETEGTIYLDAMDLATERARAVRKYMIEVGKLHANRIRVVGCGEHEPIKKNLHVEKSENQRVEIRVTAKLQPFNNNLP